MNGPSFAPVLADRRVWLFALVSAVSAVVGFYAVPNAMALGLVTRIGYWCVLAAFVLFVRALWRTFRGELGDSADSTGRRSPWSAWAAWS